MRHLKLVWSGPSYQKIELLPVRYRSLFRRGGPPRADLGVANPRGAGRRRGISNNFSREHRAYDNALLVEASTRRGNDQRKVRTSGVRHKMGSYLTNENWPETPVDLGGPQRGLQGPQISEGKPLTFCFSERKVAGVTGLEPEVSGVTGRLKVRNSINLPHPKDHTGQYRAITGQLEYTPSRYSFALSPVNVSEKKYKECRVRNPSVHTTNSLELNYE